MNNEPAINPAPRGAKVVLVAAFFALLWLPALASLFAGNTKSRVNENRFAAPFPPTNPLSSFGALKQFIAEFERYFNDHFGLRQQLIYWNHTWKRGLFAETWGSHVIIGREGWLYGTWSDDPMEEYENVNTPFTDRQLHEWQTLFESRREWLRRRGAAYVVVIPPDKQTAYPEYLSDWKSALGSSRKLDQFLDFMKRHSDVPIVDLRPALSAGKKAARTFHMTDSHWNEYGAFVAGEAVIQGLTNQIAGLEPISVQAFDLTFRDGEPGNLAHMLTGEHPMNEREQPVLSPRPPLQPLPPARMEAGAKIISHPEGRGRLVIFGDSFAEGLLAALARHFRESIYYRVYDQVETLDDDSTHLARAHVWKPGFTEEHKPTVVIDEILNSLLYIEDPEAIRRLDALQ